MSPLLVMSHLQGAPISPFKNGYVLCDAPGCMSVLMPWCACSCVRIHKSSFSPGVCIWGLVNHLKAVHREEDRSTSPSTQESQKLEGKLNHDFLSQVLYSYQPEALRVLGVHVSESNISKNKHNWGKIISLRI